MNQRKWRKEEINKFGTPLCQANNHLLAPKTASLSQIIATYTNGWNECPRKMNSYLLVFTGNALRSHLKTSYIWSSSAEVSWTWALWVWWGSSRTFWGQRACQNMAWVELSEWAPSSASGFLLLLPPAKPGQLTISKRIASYWLTVLQCSSVVSYLLLSLSFHPVLFNHIHFHCNL